MKHFYPFTRAGRFLRHRLSDVMRVGFTLALSVFMLPATAGTETTEIAVGSPQDTRGGGNPACDIGKR